MKRPDRKYVHLKCSFCGAEHPSPMREKTYERWQKQYPNCIIRCPVCTENKVKIEHGENEVMVWEYNGAMGWDCYTIREMTDEDRQAMARARAIRDAGIQQMRERKAKWN